MGLTESYVWRNHDMMTEAATHPIRLYRQAQTPAVTLDVLAKQVGISKANLSRIETGEQELTTPLAKKLSDVTGIPMRVLCPDLAKMFDAEAAE